MERQHARLADLGPALVRPIDPPGLGLRVAGPLEGTWRRHNGQSYFLVLNMSSRAQSEVPITLEGVSARSAKVRGEGRSVTVRGGTLTDSFAAYEMHVYVVGDGKMGQLRKQ